MTRSQKNTRPIFLFFHSIITFQKEQSLSFSSLKRPNQTNYPFMENNRKILLSQLSQQWHEYGVFLLFQQQHLLKIFLGFFGVLFLDSILGNAKKVNLDTVRVPRSRIGYSSNSLLCTSGKTLNNMIMIVRYISNLLLQQQEGQGTIETTWKNHKLPKPIT